MMKDIVKNLCSKEGTCASCSNYVRDANKNSNFHICTLYLWFDDTLNTIEFTSSTTICGLMIDINNNKYFCRGYESIYQFPEAHSLLNYGCVI